MSQKKSASISQESVQSKLQQLSESMAVQVNTNISPEKSNAIARTKTTLYLQLDQLITAYVDYIKAVLPQQR